VLRDVINGTGITCLLLLASLYLPVIGFVFALFIPPTVLFYRSKLGRKVGAIVPGLTFVAMTVLVGRMSVDAVLFAELLLIGFVLGELIETNLSIEKTVLYACGIILCTGVAALLFYGAIANRGMVALLSDYVAKNLEMALAIYENLGVSEENLGAISDALDRFHYYLIRVMPALVASGVLLEAWLSLLIARAMLSSRMLAFPDFGPLALWKAPDHLVWGIIGSGAALLLSDGLLRTLGLNGVIVLVTVYFFQGIAIVAFYFEKVRFPRLIRIVLYSLIAMQQVLLFIIIGMGFFDMWVNFRRLGKEEPS